MRRKFTDIEIYLGATLSIVLMVLLIFHFVMQCVADVPNDATEEVVYNCPPPNVEVHYIECETVVVEPTTVPEIITGETSFVKVGLSSVESGLYDAEIGICSWADIVLDEAEMNLLRTTVYCEAGNQDIDTQVMVALTILNRLNAGYAEDIRGVIFQDGAYAVTKWSNFEDRGWTKQVKDAVDIALSSNEYPTDMFYFRTEYYHSFATDYKRSGDLYFSTR